MCAWLLLLSSCQEPGAPCDASSACLANEICFEGRCRQVCNTDVDCDADFECYNGACVPVRGSTDASLPPVDASRFDSAADSGRGDGSGPDRIGFDAAADDAEVADVGLPDRGSPDLGLPDTGVPDPGRPETGPLDEARLEGGLPEAGGDDREVATDAAVADLASPDVADVDAGAVVWWNADWDTRHLVDLDNSAGDEHLVDFPVLVVLDPVTVDYGRTLAGGADLRFVPAGTSQVLAHEIERWDASGDSFIWVRVPLIPAGSSRQDIYMYYSNDQAADAQDPAAVWSNGFVSVWHMNGDPGGASGAILDSAASAQHGTGINMDSADLVAGLAGHGIDFDGSDDIIRIDGSRAPDSPLDIVGGPLTLSAWINRRGSGMGTLLSKRDNDRAQYQLYVNDYSAGPNVCLRWNDASGGGNVWHTVAGFPLTGTWQSFAVSLEGGGEQVAFYVDGEVEPHQRYLQASGTATHFDVDVAIGARWASDPGIYFPINGVVDEVRVANTSRSATWMGAEHRVMSGEFVHLGAQERR